MCGCAEWEQSGDGEGVRGIASDVPRKTCTACAYVINSYWHSAA